MAGCVSCYLKTRWRLYTRRLAQAFFALTVALAVFTSAGWQNVSATNPLTDGGRLRRLCAVTMGLIYLQAILGAVLRHTGDRLDAHLAFAALVALHVVFMLIRVTRHHAEVPALTRPALLFFGLLMLQLALGTLSYVAKYTTVLHLTLNPIVLITTPSSCRRRAHVWRPVRCSLYAPFVFRAWSRGRSGAEIYLRSNFLYEIHHGNRQYRDCDGAGRKAADFFELTKPRIVFMVLITSLVGYYAGSERVPDYFQLFQTLIGTALRRRAEP